MQLSRFVDFVPIENDFLAYNTLTQSVLFLDQKSKDIITNNPKQAAEDANFAPLLEEKFLVPSSIDESTIVKSWYQSVLDNNTELNLTILTTYACNLACVYCVEDGVIQPILMDLATQNKVIKWIENEILSKHILKVKICFYGGEPLLNLKAVEIISNSVRELCYEKEIEYRAEMITNGLLLSKETAENLASWGIQQLKLTIDGDRTQHNLKRPAKNQTDCYQTILDNIFNIPDSIDLIISGNYDRENIPTFPVLLNELNVLRLENRIKHISFKPILNTLVGSSPVTKHCASPSISDADLSAMISLRNEAKSHGFNVPDYLALGPCEFNNQNSLVIDPTGKFYKCAGFVGRKEFCIGSIKTGYNKQYQNFINIPLPESCIDCKYVPACGGGCRYCAQVKYGDYRKVVCEKKYFETVAKQVLIDDYYPQTQPV
ncbi:MAG: radical SAM protein [bacterium]